MTYKELAEVIRSSPNYKKGQPIRLLACEAGKNDDKTGISPAQNLANELNVRVKASDKLVTFKSNGNIELGSGISDFIIFYPSEDK